MSTITFKQHMMLEEMGFTKQDLKEVAIVPILPYIFAAYRLQRALRNANTGIKYMNRSQSLKMADEFIGPPKPVRFGDPEFVGPGPSTLMRPSRFRNFAKQINMDPDVLAGILGGVIGLLVFILVFTLRKEIAAVAKIIAKKLKELYGSTKIKFKKALDNAEEKKLEKALIKQVG